MLANDRRGFTMIEVIIAMLILTVGVLGMAGTTAYIIRQTTLSDVITERSVAFQTIVDRVQGMPYANVTSGSDSVGVFLVTWSSTNSGPQNKIVQIITRGPGMSGIVRPMQNPIVVDTFTFRILRR